ncbi:MAG: hypothetical protein ACREQA_20205, partial [Candidatus Binatia bacterium]
MGAMEGVESSSLEVEVMAKPTRRRYTAEYKLRILREAEVSSGRGELGALLRREGLYSSNLTAWRKQRERGELEGLSRKRTQYVLPILPIVPYPPHNHPMTTVRVFFKLGKVFHQLHS